MIRFLAPVLICLGFLISSSNSYGQNQNSSKVEKSENVTVFSQAGMYSVFPFLPKRQPQNEILLSFAARTVPSHDDPTGGSIIMRSIDGCRTWQVHEKLEDAIFPETANELQALKAADGTLISVYAGNEYYPKEKRGELEAKGLPVNNAGENLLSTLSGHYAKISHDDGQTWTKQELPMPNSPGVMGFHGGIMTDQGISLWPVYGLAMPGDSGHAYVYRSADSGKTWSFHEIIADSRGQIPMNETSLIDLGGGHILAFVRTGDSVDHLYRAESVNGGITWGRLSDSGITGHPADLLLLKNGHMLIVYGYRHAPFGIRARFSKDNGNTWGDELILRDDGFNSDLGYPMSIQLPDESIFTTYYMRVAGGPTHIAGTIWREP